MSVVLIAAFFLLLRLPGISLPYHQDEWKNASASMTVEGAGTFFAHPPIMQILFVASNKLLGTDLMRLFPLLFAFASAVLLYFVIIRRADRSAGIWAVILYSVCFYGIFGSLQLDVDGAVLPFFFLLAVYAYDRLPDKKWLALLLTALFVGCLIKLNFVLVLGALILDYLWINRSNQIYKKIGFSIIGLVFFGIVYILALYVIQYLYSAFSISFMLSHANQFSDAGGRNWTQIIVQGVKAIYYLSPLMLVPLLWISKETIKKTRVFAIYLALGLIFYFLLFDFSKGALDKYLMFMIIPLAVIAGVIFSQIQHNYLDPKIGKKFFLWSILIGVAISVLLIALNYLPQSVVALYPKTEWFGRVLQGKWNVLTPLNGGSGPLGFYISFLFIAVSYIVSIIVAVFALLKKQWRSGAMIILIFIGVTYNLVFSQELFFGRINGSAPQVLSDSTSFIDISDFIKKVITFNDIGSGPLSTMGKYAGRIYATPDSEEGYRKKFLEFDGYYLVVDIPRLYSNGLYYKFFDKCDVLFQSISGKISGKVYDCTQARKIVNSL